MDGEVSLEVLQQCECFANFAGSWQRHRHGHVWDQAILFEMHQKCPDEAHFAQHHYLKQGLPAMWGLIVRDESGFLDWSLGVFLAMSCGIYMDLPHFVSFFPVSQMVNWCLGLVVCPQVIPNHEDCISQISMLLAFHQDRCSFPCSCMVHRLQGSKRGESGGIAWISRSQGPGSFFHPSSPSFSIQWNPQQPSSITCWILWIFVVDWNKSHAGMGLGTRLSDLVGQLCLQSGYTMYAKTKHPRLGGWVSCKNGASSWHFHNVRWHNLSFAIGSMYGIFSCIYHKNQPIHVGKYPIHGSYGFVRMTFHHFRLSQLSQWHLETHGW